MLAGFSAGYYTRLEKGSLAGVSGSVITAFAAVRVAEAERSARAKQMAGTAGVRRGA